MTCIELRTMYKGGLFSEGAFDIRPALTASCLAHMRLIDEDGNAAYLCVDKTGIAKMIDALQEQLRIMETAESKTD